MKTLKIWNDSPSDRQIREITESLERGDIIIIPTDTLYGIACDSSNPKAIDRICKLKELNPAKNTLSILCSDISMVSEYARYDNYAYKLLRDLTPGPYTFIFRTAPTLPKAFKGRKSVGVRIPDCEPTRKIAEALGRPLMNASIDFPDEDYARDPGLIAEYYDNKIDLMVEGEYGDTIPSTIIDCTGKEAEITREGKGEV